jgi:tetratricopeptide (TPR) repeat protein
MIGRRFQIVSGERVTTTLIATILFLAFITPGLLFAQNDILILPDEKSNPQTNEGQADIYLPDEEKPEPVRIGFSVFYDTWTNFQTSLERGDGDSANQSLAQLIQLKNRNAIPGLPEFAEAAVQEGNRKMEKKRLAEALSYYAAGSALDPSFADAYYGQARVYFAQGLAKYRYGVMSVVQGFAAPRSSFRGKIYLYSKLVLIGLVALIACAAIYALILFLKYNRLLRHDAEEKLGPKISPLAAHFLIWVLLTLPVLLFFGPLWLVPFWLAIFVAYGRLTERIFAIFFLVIFVCAFPLYRGIAKYANAASDPMLASYINAISGGPNPKVVLDFERYVADHPADRDARIMLAYLYKNNEMYEEAAAILQRMMLDAPDDARAPNNLAVICFRQDETEYAVRLTQKAVQISPRNAVYKYNLSTMLRAKFNFAQAQKLIDEAKAVDPTLFADGGPGPAQPLLDVVPSADFIRKKIETKVGDPRQFFMSPFTIVSGALLLLAIFLCLTVRNGLHAHRCVQCGQAFCRKCQTVDRSYGFCIQCLHIFVKKDGVSPASRRTKMSQIENYSKKQKLLRLLGGILVPGSADVYDQHILKGVVTMFIWFLCLTIVMFALRFGPLSTYESSDNAWPIVAICLFVLAAIFILSLLRQFRHLSAE